MSVTTEVVSARGGAALPSALRTGLARGGIEIKEFFRERQGVIFTFAFPPILLLLFGEIFKGTFGGGGSAAQYFLPAMLAYGLMSTSFLNLGVGIALERDDGTLKRLRGTPMPPSAYFLGKVVLVFVTALAEAAILIAIGVAVFDIDLPDTAGRWWTFAWVGTLGVTGSSLLGIAVSSLATSARSAAAVINLPYLLLQFVSGTFIPYTVLPHGVQQVGALFPAKWLAQGMRSVFLPDALVSLEPAHSWEHGRTALVLAAWCVAGLVLCLTTFRWKGRRDG